MPTFTGRAKIGDIEYKVEQSGTAYPVDTPSAVVSWLETSRVREQRIRIFYGDTKTGRDWMQEYDIMGIVGRTTGVVKVPILLQTKNSTGGGSISCDSIVRITTNGRTVYQHPEYHLPELYVKESVESPEQQEYPFSVYTKEEGVENDTARFTTEKKAKAWVRFMKGESNRKW